MPTILVGYLVYTRFILLYYKDNRFCRYHAEAIAEATYRDGPVRADDATLCLEQDDLCEEQERRTHPMTCCAFTCADPDDDGQYYVTSMSSSMPLLPADDRLFLTTLLEQLVDFVALPHDATDSIARPTWDDDFLIGGLRC